MTHSDFRYAPGANPPGLRSPDWKILKTWHVLCRNVNAARCGAIIHAPSIAKRLPGVDTRLCRHCRERAS